jgi:hypothetical protein
MRSWVYLRAEPTMAEELETMLDSVDDLEEVEEKLVSNG